MKRCSKCNDLLLFNKWKEDKFICWACGFAGVTEYISRIYGEDARQEVYKMESRVMRK